MAELLQGVKLGRKDGSTVDAEDVLKDKIVALYFSAHWCPPCRQFSAVLKDFHSELVDSGEFEVVFVSYDRSKANLKKYVEEDQGDWYHIPFGSPKIPELATMYSVIGIPALIIIRPDGEVITRGGRNDVQKKSPQAALSAWKQAKDDPS